MKRSVKLSSSLLLSVSALALLGPAAAIAASYSETVLADNPASYWRMEDDQVYGYVSDSGRMGWNTANSSCNNSGPCQPVLGQAGIETNSAFFHPTNIDGTVYYPYLSVPFSPDLNPVGPSAEYPSGPFAVEAWVRPISAAASGWRTVLSSYDQNANREGWFIYHSSAPNPTWIWVQDFGGIWLDAGSAPVFEWQHLAISFDGTNVSFYVNGALKGTADSHIAKPNTAGNLIIGALNPEGGYFDGNVDEVAIYTNALAADKIALHYAVGITNIRVVAQPPTITAEPESVTAYAGHSVKFSVAADGTRPFNYQWYKGSTAMAGETNDNLVFVCSLADNNTSYKVRISNASGFMDSSVATLTVQTNLVLKSSPVSITRTEGSKAAFRAPIEGAGPISIQWYKDTTPFPGGTNETLWLSNLQLTDSSSTYYAHITNPYVSTNSESATLTVVPRANPVQLTRYGKVVAADDPVAYWRLDQSSMGDIVVDAVGSFDGTFEDASTGGTGVFTFDVASGIPAETNKAISITGGAWAKIPYALELNPHGPFTLETWIQPSSTSENGSDYRAVLATMGSGPTGWHIYQLPGTSTMPGGEFVITTWGGNWANVWLYSGEEVVANKWYHMVVNYDGSVFRMYLNGILRVEEGWDRFVQNDDGAMVFGWRTDKDWKPFRGVIDDVAFYNKVLTPSQVEAHHAASVRLTMTKVDNKVILSWPFGTLQQATSLNGTYADQPSITSPYTNSPGATPAYFRVKAY
jgi:hypothetical protein